MDAIWHGEGGGRHQGITVTTSVILQAGFDSPREVALALMRVEAGVRIGRVVEGIAGHVLGLSNGRRELRLVAVITINAPNCSRTMHSRMTKLQGSLLEEAVKNRSAAARDEKCSQRHIEDRDGAQST